MTTRWRGRETDQPQLANANEGFRDLSPVSEVPAQQAFNNWAATLPDTDPVPLIWERNDYGREEG